MVTFSNLRCVTVGVTVRHFEVSELSRCEVKRLGINDFPNCHQ